jgi:hypothetical protein
MRAGSSTGSLIGPDLHEPRIPTWRDHLAGRGPAAFACLTAVLLSADPWLPGAQRARGAGGTLVVV